MTREAFDLSERFQVPVMIRITTRLAHSRAGVRTRLPRSGNPLEQIDGQGGVDPPTRECPEAV